MRLSILDVFAESAFSGNQLAVVQDAANLSTAAMQRIAAEMDYSETTFVVAQSANAAQVRIFTPVAELPFAGHPTLGTAWLLADGKAQFKLSLAIGDATVNFTDGVGWFDSPAVQYTAGMSHHSAAELLGLNISDIDQQQAIQQGDIGPVFHIVKLNSEQALNNISISGSAMQQLQLDRPDKTVGVMAVDAAEKSQSADWQARTFFDVNGPREDPATGSANCIFAGLLAQQAKGADFDATVIQGAAMGRPSKLYLRSTAGKLSIGGKVQRVLAGELDSAAISSL